MSRKKIDLTGKMIGDLKIIREIRTPYIVNKPNEKRSTIIKLECLCKCGRIFYPYKSNVLYKKTTHCIRCPRKNSLIGKRIGKLEVLSSFIDENSKHQMNYKLKCDCGNAFSTNYLKIRRIKGCFCPKCKPKKRVAMPRKEFAAINNFNKHLIHKKKILGKKFGYLKVLKFEKWEYGVHRRRPIYLCKCKCGNKILVRGDGLGRILSCGCLHRERILKGEENYQARFKNIEAQAIRELLKSGLYTGREIAKMYNVCETLISSIKNNQTYKDLK